MYPLKKALLENLIRLLDSEKEELVQVACRLLKVQSTKCAYCQTCMCNSWSSEK